MLGKWNYVQYYYVKGTGWVPGYEEFHTFETDTGVTVTFIAREPQLGEYGNYVEKFPGSWYFSDGKIQLNRLEDWGRQNIYKSDTGHWLGARVIDFEYLERMKNTPNVILFTIVIHDP